MVNFHRDVYCLLGLPFDAVSLADAVQCVRDSATHRMPCFMSTPNLNFVIGCLNDEKFRDSVINSDLSVVDGMPLVWIARLLGVPIRERVPGSTLFEQLRIGSGKPLSVFFFGGADGSAEAACQRLRLENNGLTCVGYESPGYGTIEDMSSDGIIQRINASKADFLVVALGAKKGQAWIERNRARIAVPVISHLGAVLNFVAGTVRRAPVWMHNTGLEWLWRIREEPALWRRYFGDGVALLSILFGRVLPYAMYVRCHKPGVDEFKTATVEILTAGQNIAINLQGAWSHKNISLLQDCFSKMALGGRDIHLDMGRVTYIDSAVVGLVILLLGQQKQQHSALLLIAVSRPARRVIRYCCAEFLIAEFTKVFIAGVYPGD